MNSELHTTWIEVSTGALKHNLAQVRSLVGNSVKIMAVVKADAYGHGIIGAAKAFVEGGADFLGVTTIEEGLALRHADIDADILVFTPLLPGQVDAAIEANLNLTVCDKDSASAASSAAERIGKRAQVHIKIDTGMGRLGINPDDAPGFAYGLYASGMVEIKGIYTHFANAGSNDLSQARAQNSSFAFVLESLRSKDFSIGLCHSSNSAAILNLPEARYDMVRPGTILYGQYPSRNVARKIELKDTWCLKSRIISLRKLPEGTKIGYGSEFITKRATMAAVLPVGFADGFTLIPESAAKRSANPLRSLAAKVLRAENDTYVSIRGKHAPVIGRVSMQMCTVDVTDIPGVFVGDEVAIPARRVSISRAIPKIYVD